MGWWLTPTTYIQLAWAGSFNHTGEAAEYTAKVTGSARDCLTRQAKEAVLITRCEIPVLNSKTEFHPPALWQTQNEIYRS